MPAGLDDAHDLALAFPSPPSSPAIGFVPGEGFRLKSADGSYLLRIALQVGFKFEPAWTNGDGDVRGAFGFVRPIFRGNFYKPWFGYRVSLELAHGAPYLLDTYFDVERWKFFGFRFGQQGTPVGRHENFGPTQIFFPDFNGVASYFWSGRERGLTAFGSAGDGIFDYYAGLYGGSPLRESLDAPQTFLAEARATVSPLGPVNANELPFTPEGGSLPFRVSFTAQGYHGKLQSTVENYNPTQSILTPMQTLKSQLMTSLGGDLWLQGGPLIVFGEFYWRSLKSADTNLFGSLGAWGQVLVNAYRNIIGVGARVSWLNPNTALAHDQAFELEEQVAWFIHAPELVLKLRHSWIDQHSPDPAALGSFILPFPTGNSQLFTLQLSMGF